MPTPQSALAALAATTLAATLVAVAAPTTPAHASDVPSSATSLPGSIVLLKDYNVWLVRPDGTGLVQVTKDGTFASQYYSPSMADDGTIAAGKGQEIVRLKQNGTVLNRMDPPPLMNSVGQPQDGVPVSVAISPDGTRIAWSTASATCPVAAECGARMVTGVTSASVLTPPTTTSYFGDPSWVSNTRLMVHGGYGSQMMLQDVGGARSTGSTTVRSTPPTPTSATAGSRATAACWWPGEGTGPPRGSSPTGRRATRAPATPPRWRHRARTARPTRTRRSRTRPPPPTARRSPPARSKESRS